MYGVGSKGISGTGSGAGSINTKTWDPDWRSQIDIYGLFGPPTEAEFTPKPWLSHACRCGDYITHGGTYNFDASNLGLRFWLIKILDATGEESVDFETHRKMMKDHSVRNTRSRINMAQMEVDYKKRAAWIAEDGGAAVGGGGGSGTVN